MSIRNLLVRGLIALMLWTPYHLASAGMIATDAGAAPHALTRADVALQLQAFGVDSQQARERANAMSNDELAAVNRNIASLPAGQSDALVLVVILVAIGLWWYMRGR